MNFESVVLIHRKDGKFSEEGFSIRINNCFDNIKSFYEEDNNIFLILSLQEEFTDDKFDEIFENFCYDDFEELGIKIYPKDDEYYPTFIIEMENDLRDNVQNKIDIILELFREKVVKIYCNEM